MSPSAVASPIEHSQLTLEAARVGSITNGHSFAEVIRMLGYFVFAPDR